MRKRPTATDSDRQRPEATEGNEHKKTIAALNSPRMKIRPRGAGSSTTTPFNYIYKLTDLPIMYKWREYNPARNQLRDSSP